MHVIAYIMHCVPETQLDAHCWCHSHQGK